MTKTSKKGLIPFLIFLILLISTIVSVNPVSSGVSDFTLENWDGYNVGVKSTSEYPSGSMGHINFTRESGIFEIDNEYEFSSPNSLRMEYGKSHNGVGWLNLTNPISYINSITLHIDLDSTGDSGNYASDYYKYLYFYNSEDDEVLKLKFSTSYEDTNRYIDFDCFDNNDIEHLIERTDDVEFSPDGYLVITHLSGNSMNYSWFDTSGTLKGSIIETSRSSTDWSNFSYMYFGNDGGGTPSSNAMYTILFLDDIIIDTQYQADEYEVADYSSYCSGGVGAYTGVGGRPYVEHQFETPFSGKIHAVDLFIGIDQLNSVSNDLSDYSLYVNGVSFGNPVAIIPMSSNFALRWYSSSGITLSNDRPLFSFKSSKYVRYGVNDFYWYTIGINPENPNPCRMHTSESYFQDDIFNGELKVLTIAMCFYTTTVTQTGGEKVYNDTVYTQPKNTDTYQELENILISYQLSIIPDSYLQLWWNEGSGIIDTQYTGQGYHSDGRHLTQQSGVSNFVPMKGHNGSWQVILVRNDINITYHNFSVISRDADDYNAQIFTTPNPSNIGETFIIGWYYNASAYDDKKAKVVYTNTPYLTDDYNLLVSQINSNDLAGHYFSLNVEGTYYFWLCILEDGILNPLDSSKHIVGQYLLTGDYIDVVEDIYPLNTERSDVPRAFVNYVYSHTYPDCEVYINYPNTSYSQYYVGDTVYNELETQFSVAGYYSIELILYQGEDYIVLDSDTFMVGEYVYEDVEYNPILFYIQSLDSLSRLCIGIAIIIIMLLLPLIVMAKLDIQLDIHPLIYLVLGCVGVIIAMFIGCWGWEIPFFICFISVMIGLLSWLHGRE